MKPHRRSCAGFTWVEVLVLLGILCLLAFMMLPARVNEQGNRRRMECANNQKQLGTALLNHNGRHNSLPPGLANCKDADWHQVEGVANGANCQGPNWLSAILPDLDLGREYDKLIECLDLPTTNNACAECPVGELQIPAEQKPFRKFVPDEFVCGYDDAAGEEASAFSKYGLPADANQKLAKGSYAACFGSKFYLSSHTEPETAGVFEVVSIGPQPADTPRHKWLLASSRGTRMAQVSDGTSKTIMVSELLCVASANDPRGVWTWSGMGGSTFTGYLTPNSPAPDALPICETDPQFYKDGLPPLCTAELRTNTARSPDVYAAARSRHPGSVNVVLADMSAHTIDDSIDPKVWRALCTRAGNFGEENTGVPR